MADMPDRVEPQDADVPEPDVAPVTAPVTAPPPPQGMLPARERRRFSAERGLMRVIAGEFGGRTLIPPRGTALAAILGSAGVAAWIIGLAVSALAVVLAALLWSSRQL